MKKSFDYIIIGAGSAGCVLANRLSKDKKTSVCLLESGPKSNTWKVDMPSALLYTMHDPQYNWKYYSEPEPYLNNRRIFCPRGKMIGGCSSHNGMVFVRGNPLDFERWASYDLPKWSYKNVLPYFKKLETWSGGENLYRGGNGPLKVNRSKIDDAFPLFKSLIKAAAEAGYDTFEDSNGFKQDGFGTFDVTIDNGKRQGVSRAYLNEINGYKNLSIEHNTDVSKIIFKEKKAIGVEVKRNNNHTDIYYCNKEVLLSSGSINSPKILQLSGIGDEKVLKKNGIDIVNHLPGVGKNLQDHLEIYIQHKSKIKDTLYNLSTNYFTQAIEGVKWFLLKKGMLTFSHLEVGGFVKTSEKYKYPNIQLHFFPSLVINHGLINPSFDGFQFHASPNRPKSRGFVEINSNNYLDDPKIQFNYLEHEEDLQQMRDSVKIANKIFKQKSMKKYLGDQLRPGYDATDDELDNIIRDTADTAYHPSCTNKMGMDSMSVVDEETKVYGVENLRVIDSSIMPDILSGNLNAGTIMIAEKAADIILGKEESPIEADYYS